MKKNNKHHSSESTTKFLLKYLAYASFIQLVLSSVTSIKKRRYGFLE